MLEPQQQLILNTVENRLTEEEMGTLQGVAQHYDLHESSDWSQCEDDDGSLRATVQTAIDAALKDRQLGERQARDRVSDLMEEFFLFGAMNLSGLASDLAADPVVTKTIKRYREADKVVSFLVEVRDNALAKVSNTKKNGKRKAAVR